MVSGVDGLVGGVDLAEIATESVLQVVEAGLDVGCRTLQESFDRAVGTIPDIAGQVVVARRTVGGIAKAHSPDPAFEDDLFGDLTHCFFHGQDGRATLGL